MTDEQIAKLIVKVVENDIFEGTDADEEVEHLYQHIKDASPGVRRILLKTWTDDLSACPSIENYARVCMVLLADRQDMAAIPEILAKPGGDDAGT